jgi:hypothetical protein
MGCEAFWVEDDGRASPESGARASFDRGARLDTGKPGTGLVAWRSHRARCCRNERYGKKGRVQPRSCASRPRLPGERRICGSRGGLLDDMGRIAEVGMLAEAAGAALAARKGEAA